MSKFPARAYYSGLLDKPKFHYIVIDDLPEHQRTPFLEWIAGESQPVIDEKMEIDCAFYEDYSIWYDYWTIGEVAPKT